MEQRRRLTTNAVAVFFTLLVLCVTLYPFELTTVGFEQRLQSLQTQNLSKFKGLVDDVIINILLFIPVGFSFGLVYSRRRRSAFAGLLLVTVAGLAMSSLVEFLQLYVPFRFSSYLDVISNGIGTAGGYGLSLLAGNTFLNKIHSLFSPRHKLSRYAVLYCAWWVFFLILVFPLSYALRVNDWDKKAPLVVGSNADGSGKVSGSLAYFGMTKMGMSESEVRATLERGALVPERATDIVAEYNMEGQPPYRSLTKHSTSLTADEHGILRTKSAFTHAASWIMFTTVFTAYIDYRSVALHGDEYETLVMLGREQDDVSFALMREGEKLVIAMRSMVTGYTAHHPVYIVPGFFDEAGSYRILVTLDQLRLRVYKNELKNAASFTMGPGFALTNRFLPTRYSMNITSPFSGINEWIFACLIFIPLGFFTGKVLRMAETNLIRAATAVPMLLLPVISINYACGYMLFRPFDEWYSFLCGSVMLASMVFTFALARSKNTEKAGRPAISIPEPSIVHEHSS